MYLLGASGHAKVILDILQLIGIRVLGFYDDNDKLDLFKGVSRQGAIVNMPIVSEPCIISIGSNGARKTIAKNKQLNYQKAIHPKSTIANGVLIDEGTVVMAGAIINSDTKIGKHVIINTAASVDHDCIIKDYAHISPNATLCGGVIIGEGAHVGAGAVVIPGVTIGDWAVVGAGAVVVKNVAEGVTVMGSPAKNRMQ